MLTLKPGRVIGVAAVIPAVTASVTPRPPIDVPGPSAGKDAITLRLSQDTVTGAGAQIGISVDGLTIETFYPYTIKSLHASGASDTVTFQVTQANQHSLSVWLMNDAPAAPKIVYVEAVLVNGTLIPGAVGRVQANGTVAIPMSGVSTPPVVTPPVVTPPVVTPPPPPTGAAPRKLSGIKFTQTDPVHPEAAYGAIVGFADAIDGIGPFKWGIVDMVGGKYNVRQSPLAEVYGYWTAFDVTEDRIQITCTDGRGDTVTSAPILIRKTDGKSPTMTMNSRNPAFNASINSFYDGPGFAPQAFGSGSAWKFSLTLPDGSPSKAWTDQYGVVHYALGGPVKAGLYPLLWTFTNAVGNTLALPRSILINDFPPIDYVEFLPVLVSTSMPPGAYIGKVAVTTPNNAPTFSLVDPTNTVQIDSTTGVVTCKATPKAAGNLPVTVSVVDNYASKAVQFNIPVQVGKTIDPSKMTLTNVNNLLDNVQQTQHIGNVKVDAVFDRTPVYLISFQTRFCAVAANPNYGPRIVVDSKTGSIDAVKMLSVGDDTITVCVTDGITTCTQSFVINTRMLAPTTSYYVGKGDPATVGLGVPANAIKLPNLSEARRKCIAYHSDHIHFYVDDDLTTIDEYADDTTGGGDWGLRGPWTGPLTIEFLVRNKVEPKNHLGGFSSNDRPGGGDMRGKGSLVIGDGDAWIIGFIGANAHGWDLTHGIESVRKDGETYGDLTMVGGDITDCDQGLEAGVGHGKIKISQMELGNCGTSHVSAGACHNIYIGQIYSFEMYDCISRHSTLGHLVKSRAENTIIQGNRIFDGLTGSSSCCIDTPNGGNVTLRGNFVEKGTMTMNPYAIQYAAEGLVHANNVLTIENNTVSILTLGGSHAGWNAGIAVFSALNRDGAPIVVNANNNKYFSSDKSLATGRFLVHPPYDSAVTKFNETNTTVLAAPPIIDLTTRPYYSGALPILGPLYFHGLWGQDYFNNFDNAQQIADREQIVLPPGTPANTVICRIYGHSDMMEKRVNAFGPGTKAAIIRDSVFYKDVLPDPWAPDGQFGIITNADGTADLVTLVDASKIMSPDKVAYVQVRLTAPNGDKADSRYPIKLVAGT